MVISGKTRVCAIIGNPIDHSLSPIMHNAAFKELGLNLVYVAFTIKTEELKSAINGVKSLGFKGLNITMPHKNEIINYLDEVEATAKSIGAVNTILNRKGRLIGYNTDGIGAMIALQKKGIMFQEKKLVLLGSGGAAKAIAYEAVKDVGELVIVNRTLEKAKKMAVFLKKVSKTKIRVGALSFEVLKEELDNADILINSTSVGMYPQNGTSPIPSELLHSNLSVMDIIYNPLSTKLLMDAKKAGATIVSGLDMLINQGAIAFEIWTNNCAPLEVMRKAVLKQLKKQGVCL